LQAKTVGEQLRKENGAARASDLIEAFLNQRPPAEKESNELTYASRN
jgi:hypothetical protein